MPLFLNYITWSSLRLLALAIYGILYAGFLVHEVGHAVCGRLVGIKITSLRVGDGPSYTLWRNSPCPVTLGLRPKGGEVGLPEMQASDAALFFMYSGGALATAIAMLAVLLVPCHSPTALLFRFVSALVFGAMSIDNIMGYSPDGKAMREIFRRAAIKNLKS